MARLIDRRVAIEAIKEIRDKIWDVDIPSPTVPEYIEHHQQMIHLMNECDNKLHELYLLPSAQPEQRWIPCSERLPKENGHYLVTFHQTATEEDLGFDMDDTDVRKMRYDTKHGWRTPRHIPSWINDAVVSTVLAWMPLPEPYKAIDAMHSLPSAQPEQDIEHCATCIHDEDSVEICVLRKCKYAMIDCYEPKQPERMNNR